MSRILNDVKEMLGISSDDDHFDTNIIIDINTAFSILNQLGAGPVEGFQIISEEDVWDEFTSDTILLNKVKTYVFLKTKMLFDPPSSSSLIESINNLLNELEFRINTYVETAT